MQALLQRVQELVVSHANVPSNGAHWSAVLETASGKEASKEAKQARVDKAALEVASSMANLAPARAEVMSEWMAVERRLLRAACDHPVIASRYWML